MRNAVRRTKIVATLGPAWAEPAQMTALLDAGVNVVRINASHATPEIRADWITRLQTIINGRTESAAILLDLQGPRIRVGHLEEPMRLERVGQSITGKAKATERVTDGAISADGKVVMLRTRNSLTFYRGPEFLRGDFQVISSADLSALGEPQGEGVAFGAGNAVYVASEGGGKKAPGRLGVLSCRP